VEFLDEINVNELAGIQARPSLKEKILGKSDSYIAKAIEELGNSDWVKGGIVMCAHFANKQLARNLRMPLVIILTRPFKRV